jgi:hypothetical protein
VSVGLIDYGEEEFGALVYVKGSLTGDESDYVRDYGRRNPSFPHERTSDQLFSEEQFEVYRALGFHAAHRFLSGKDSAIVWGQDECLLKKIEETDPEGLLAMVREALLPERRSMAGKRTDPKLERSAQNPSARQKRRGEAGPAPRLRSERPDNGASGEASSSDGVSENDDPPRDGRGE